MSFLSSMVADRERAAVGRPKPWCATIVKLHRLLDCTWVCKWLSKGLTRSASSKCQKERTAVRPYDQSIVSRRGDARVASQLRGGGTPPLPMIRWRSAFNEDTALLSSITPGETQMLLFVKSQNASITSRHSGDAQISGHVRRNHHLAQSPIQQGHTFAGVARAKVADVTDLHKRPRAVVW